MYNLVAEKYGGALFDVAREREMQEEILQELRLVTKTLQKVPELKLFLDHPEVDSKDKKEVIIQLFGDELSQEMKNFLFVVFDKRREAYFQDIVENYEKLLDAYTRVQKITVTTTIPLNDTQRRKITKFLAKRLRTNIRLEERIDPSIMGGLVLDMEGRRLDRSIAKKLESLRYELTR